MRKATNMDLGPLSEVRYIPNTYVLMLEPMDKSSEVSQSHAISRMALSLLGDNERTGATSMMEADSLRKLGCEVLRAAKAKGGLVLLDFSEEVENNDFHLRRVFRARVRKVEP